MWKKLKVFYSSVIWKIPNSNSNLILEKFLTEEPNQKNNMNFSLLGITCICEKFGRKSKSKLGDFQ